MSCYKANQVAVPPVVPAVGAVFPMRGWCGAVAMAPTFIVSLHHKSPHKCFLSPYRESRVPSQATLALPLSGTISSKEVLTTVTFHRTS